MPQKTWVTPDGLIGFARNANCTLATCDLKYSAYEYRPERVANGYFVALFAISGTLHYFQGFYAARSSRYSRQWFYSLAMAVGCFCEVIGYAARIWMWYNPFAFWPFFVQDTYITFAPAFFGAAIYITIGQIVRALGAQRFNPRYYAYIFIPCDVIALTLQGTGGILSTFAIYQPGLRTTNAGLSFQVLSLLAFIALLADWILHWRRSIRTGVARRVAIPSRFRVFAWLIAGAIILILARCVYRIAELSQGYQGKIFVDEAGFIVMEGVLMTCTTFMLNVANPMRVFDKSGSLIRDDDDLHRHPRQQAQHWPYEKPTHHDGQRGVRLTDRQWPETQEPGNGQGLEMPRSEKQRPKWQMREMPSESSLLDLV